MPPDMIMQVLRITEQQKTMAMEQVPGEPSCSRAAVRFTVIARPHSGLGLIAILSGSLYLPHSARCSSETRNPKPKRNFPQRMLLKCTMDQFVSAMRTSFEEGDSIDDTKKLLGRHIARLDNAQKICTELRPKMAEFHTRCDRRITVTFL